MADLEDEKDEGGGEVKDEEKDNLEESEGSQETKASEVPSGGGERSRTFGSMVSPTLDPLVNPNVPSNDKEAEGADKPKKSKKAQKRANERAKRKEKRDRAMQELQDKFKTLMDSQEQPDPDDPDDDEESTTLSSSSNRSRQEDAEYIRKLEAMLAVSGFNSEG